MRCGRSVGRRRAGMGLPPRPRDQAVPSVGQSDVPVSQVSRSSTGPRANALDRVTNFGGPSVPLDETSSGPRGGRSAIPPGLMFRRPKPVVCVTNWLPSDDNEYLDRLTAALRTVGVTPVPIRPVPGVIVRTFARGARVVHVHWPEYLVRPFTTSRRDAALNAARLARLAAGLVICRLLRMRIVWTVHNLGPHEGDASWAAFRAYELVARAADVFVVHSRAAARRVEARFPRARGRVVVAPHGHYRGAHPQPAAGRAEVRARYGVPPGAFLLLAFGQVRRYKRLAELARAVAAADGGEVHLLVAGAALERDLARELESVATNVGRVHLDLRRIPS